MSEKVIIENSNELAHTKLSEFIDNSIQSIHKYSAWVWLVLVILVCLAVLLRYVFNNSYIWIEELQWHLYGAGFMLALSEAFVRDAHIRVDLIYAGFKNNTRAIIEALGILLMLWPFLITVLVFSWPFVMESFTSNEISSNPGGLTHRWFIKSFILVGFGLLFIASVSRLSQCFATIFMKRG